MKTIFVFFLSFFSFHVLQAQSNDSVYTYVQQMPSFKGNLFNYINDSLKIQKLKKDEPIKTSPVVSFIVEKDGTIDSIKIVYHSMPEIDSAMITCFKKMPKWQPGMQNKKPVRVLFKMRYNVEIKE